MTEEIGIREPKAHADEEGHFHTKAKPIRSSMMSTYIPYARSNATSSNRFLAITTHLSMPDSIKSFPAA